MPKLFEQVRPDSVPPWITNDDSTNKDMFSFMDNIKMLPTFLEVRNTDEGKEARTKIEKVLNDYVQMIRSNIHAFNLEGELGDVIDMPIQD